MLFSREIRRIFLGILIALTLIGLSATYWAVAGRETLLQREDNPRIIEALARIQRGSIQDRHGQILAETVAVGSALQRRYPAPSSYSIVGYYSLRYGVGGVEAAFDAELAGSRAAESPADYFERELLRQPQVGSDIKLTLDAKIQSALVSAMQGTWGAAVVIDAENGDVLAMTSLPSYDPNTLDEDWSALIEQAGDPFFNRALQGHYQLGGSIYLLWLMDAFQTGFDVSARIDGATEEIELGDGTTVSCVVVTEASALSLTKAFIQGCPLSFDRYRQAESASAYQELILRAGFREPAGLAGFAAPEPISPPAVANAGTDAAAEARRQALGQGEITTSPLHLATLIAAIVNEGMAVSPQILLAQREPKAKDWSPNGETANRRRIMDAGAARALRSVLADAWRQVVGPPIPGAGETGGHMALSQAGEDTQLWLNGYFASTGGKSFAFVIVLENLRQLEQIVAIGQALSAALDDRY